MMSDSSEHRDGLRWRTVMDRLSSFAVLVASCVVVWALLLKPTFFPSQASRSTAELPLPKEPISITRSEKMGRGDAKVALIEYSDFQCPFCSKFATEILPAIERKYVETGKVVLAFRYFPLEKIHPFALRAAETANCAGRQGKFWEMHNALFVNGKEDQLDDDGLRRRAQAVGLNLAQLSECVSDGALAASVREDLTSGRNLGVTGTPAFFVGRVQSDGRVKVEQRINGVRNESEFVAAIDKLLVGKEARVR